MEIKNKRSANGMATNNMMNEYADILIARIIDIIKENNKSLCSIDSAIVDSVNIDGTINIYFPPDKDKIFTNISNQTPFMLQAGDNVEIMLKNGLYSNCWVIARHSLPNTINSQKAISDATNKVNILDDNIVLIQEQVNVLSDQINNLQAQLAELTSLKANLESPNFTGSPTAPTVVDETDSSTKLATTEFVQNAINAAVQE